MRKRGLVNTGWKERFFVLDHHVLSYYPDEVTYLSGGRAKGSLIITKPDQHIVNEEAKTHTAAEHEKIKSTWDGGRLVVLHPAGAGKRDSNQSDAHAQQQQDAKEGAGRGAASALQEAEHMGVKGGVVIEVLLSRTRRCEFALHIPQRRRGVSWLKGELDALRSWAGASDDGSSEEMRPSMSHEPDDHHHSRTYYFQVDTEEEMSRWIHAIAQAPPPPEGWDHDQLMGSLQKRGANNTAWQDRFFVLDATEQVLTYYLDESAFRSGAGAKGVIRLCRLSTGLVSADDEAGQGRGVASVESLVEGPSSFQFVIHAVSGRGKQLAASNKHDRSFFLRAESLEEMRKWMAAVGSVISLFNPSSGEAPVSSLDVAKSNTPRSFGFLRKRGETNTAYQQRYFNLQDGVVSYFKDEIAYATGKEPNGSFSLRAQPGAKPPYVEASPGADDHEFVVHTFSGPEQRQRRSSLFAGMMGKDNSGHRSYICQAESKEDMERWISTIREEISRCAPGSAANTPRSVITVPHSDPDRNVSVLGALCLSSPSLSLSLSLSLSYLHAHVTFLHEHGYVFCIHARVLVNRPTVRL